MTKQLTFNEWLVENGEHLKEYYSEYVGERELDFDLRKQLIDVYYICLAGTGVKNRVQMRPLVPAQKVKKYPYVEFQKHEEGLRIIGWDVSEMGKPILKFSLVMDSMELLDWCEEIILEETFGLWLGEWGTKGKLINQHLKLYEYILESIEE